jgi:eukaryotic-like serine/threonine-protein kinase
MTDRAGCVPHEREHETYIRPARYRSTQALRHGSGGAKGRQRRGRPFARFRSWPPIRTFMEFFSQGAFTDGRLRMPMSNGAQHSLIGQTLGKRYVVERVLGTGAMGTVYCARHVGLGALVAIKVLHPRLASDPGLVQRFEREAFATSRLDHPNALRVLDFGQDGELLYLVTEYVEAEDLLTVMEAEWPLSDQRIVEILSQVLSALVAVHEIGIVHRDLKPENILVLADEDDDGVKVDVVKVCDFGIAKVARQSLPQSRSFAPRLTEEGVVMGTPDYMSPEQAQGHVVDGRSDLYSIGVVLYHLLAGQTPFTADSPVGIVLQHVSETPVPPSHHRNVHPGLEAVCLRALSKRPEDRFQSAREMRKALRDAWTANSTALAVAPVPVTALQMGSTFSTSRPAVLPLREEIALHRSRENHRRQKRSVLAYAAVASVTLAASAVVVSRGSSATDPVERAYQFPATDSIESPGRVHAGIALVSSPSPEGAGGPSFAAGTSMERELSGVSEAAATMGEDPNARLPRIVASPPSESSRRLVPRSRPQASAKSSVQRSVVALSPPASPIPAVASADALLIRSEPWQNLSETPESPPSIAVQPPSAERREATESRASKLTEAPPSAQNAQSSAPRREASAASLDTGRASMGFSNVVTSAGISGAKVKVGLSHVPLLACYQEALRSRPASPLDTQLRLTIDVGGRIVGATLSKDGELPGLRGCIESAARGARIQGVDTGDGSATVHLRFSPR